MKDRHSLRYPGNGWPVAFQESPDEEDSCLHGPPPAVPIGEGRSGRKARPHLLASFQEIVGAATVELATDRFAVTAGITVEPRGNRTLASVEGFFRELEQASGQSSG